jgi:hypothetical protein
MLFSSQLPSSHAGVGDFALHCAVRRDQNIGEAQVSD